MLIKKNISFLFLFFSICFGANWSVPGDFNTIQEAINASSSGDVISVSSGTYQELKKYLILSMINKFVQYLKMVNLYLLLDLPKYNCEL